MGIIDDVYPDGTPVQKSVVRADDKTAHRRTVPDVNTVQSNDFSGQFAGLYVRALQATFDLDTGDATSPHNGTTVLVDNAGNRFKIVNSGGGAGIYVEKAGDAMTGPLETTRLDVFDPDSGGGEIKTFGDSRNPPGLHGLRANGTLDDPEPVTKGMLALGIGSKMWNGSTYSDHANVALHFVATEDQAPGQWGGYLSIAVTPKGTETRVTPFQFTSERSFWAHGDSALFDPTDSTQTAPIAGTAILASGYAESKSMVALTYGGGTAGFRGGVAGGTPAAPTATTNLSYLAFLAGHGWESTNAWYGPAGLFGIKAVEDFTATARGAALTFETAGFGEILRTERGRWHRGLTIGSPTGGDKGDGTINVSGGVFHNGVRPYRERLAADRTYYVRADLGAATVTLATPGVWTLNGHGLSNNDPFVVSIKPDTAAATITAASPAVVTRNSHGFAAGQPIKFSSTGYLPTGITAGTTYYVIAAGLTTNTFQFSATVGGSAINSTAISSSFTNASSTITSGAAHGLVVGQLVRFAGTVATNFSAGVDYYVLSTPTGTTFTVSATNGGSAISAGSSASGGTVVQTGTHFVGKTGALPTGITEGTIYFARNVTTNTFEFATTSGGSSVATSGSQTGVFNIGTGNDANSGLAATRSAALLTPQKFIDTVSQLDISIYNVTGQLAAGTYNSGVVVNGPWLGSGAVTMQGDLTTPQNVVIDTGSSTSVRCTNGGMLTVHGIKFAGTGTILNSDFGGHLTYGNVDIAGSGSAQQVRPTDTGTILCDGNYSISGGGLLHANCNSGGSLRCQGKTITLVGVPTFSISFVNSSIGASAILNSNTFAGSATGARYGADMNGVIYTNGSNNLPGNSVGTTATGGQVN